MYDKVKTCLLFGALGDAFGTRFEQVDVPAGEERWSFSDDTQLTLATCEAIIDTGSPDPQEIAIAFQRWYRTGKLSGLGASTLKALVELIAGGHWATVGAKGERSAGNGAAMRIAPLAFMVDPLTESGRTMIRDICRITHHNDEAYVGALAMVLAIRFVQNDRQNYIQNIIRQLPDTQVKARLIKISQTPEMRIRDIGRRFGSTGFVADSVPLALFAAQKVTEIGFKGMINELIAAGGDTDTNCHLAGQVAGVQLGMEAIPDEWMKKLRETPRFEEHYETIKEFASFVADSKGIKTLF